MAPVGMAEIYERNGRKWSLSLRNMRHTEGQEALAEAKEILDLEDDEELRDMAREEIKELESQIEESEARLLILLLPKDPNDEKNVILEVRAGTGGDEAALFGGDLLRMYLRYAERKR